MGKKFVYIILRKYLKTKRFDLARSLESRLVEDDEILVSYDVASLFTAISLQETIDYVLDQIYKEQKLPQITTRIVIKRLLERTTKGTISSSNGTL